MKNYRELDSLDKFLTIRLRLLDNEIADCEKRKDSMFLKPLQQERSLIVSIANFVRHEESLTEEELELQLKIFEGDPNLASFLAFATTPIDMKKLLDK